MSVVNNKKFLIKFLLINFLFVTSISGGLVRRDVINSKSNVISKTNDSINKEISKNQTNVVITTTTTASSELMQNDDQDAGGNNENLSLSNQEHEEHLDDVDLLDNSEMMAADEEEIGLLERTTVADEVGETTTEYHFDISRYMSNSSESQQSDNETETIETSTPADEEDEDVDMEKRFENMELTTPSTPDFDKTHEEYKQSTFANDSEENDDDTREMSTTESTPASRETTTPAINLADIKENSTETKTTSHFSNLMTVEKEKYDIETKEVNVTTIRPPNAKERTGKQLENIEDGSGSTTTSTDDESSSWAVSAMKNVEQLSTVTGQHYNISTTDLGAINDPTIMKSVSDWATIMENIDFDSDATQTGDITTTTATDSDEEEEETEATSDSVGEGNVIITMTVKPPSRRPSWTSTRLTRPPKANPNKTASRLDDISFDGDDGVETTTSSYDRNTLPVDEKKKIVSSETTTSFDDELNISTTTEEITTENVKTTTEDNIIAAESKVKVQPTSAQEPTETIQIETIDADHSSPSNTYYEEGSSTYSEGPNKVDPTLDSNSIERSTLSPGRRTRPTTVSPRGTAKYTTIDDNVENFDSVSPQENENIEVITTEVPSVSEDGELYTEVSNGGDTEQGAIGEEDLPKEEGGADAKTILAITMSTLGVLALIGLVGLLFVMRKRQKKMTYQQRCRPVGLDAYSLDNVSVYNSVRRKNNMRMSKRSYGNSAFEDPALKNNVLSIPNLAMFIQNQNSIFEEFKDIPMITARVDEVPQGCESKNRYANVVPLPETRVSLKRLNDDEKTEYINANFVKGPKDAGQYYIATQAPLESTIPDFWRMIWEQNSKVILMVTDLNEEGVEKCAEYLPSSMVLDNQRLYDDLQVTLKNREVKEKYAVSTIHLKNMQTNTWREITHFWYQWPETGVPSDEASIIAMLLEARSYLKMSAPEQSDAEIVSAEEIKEEGTENTPTTNGSIDKSKSLQRNQGPLTVHCSPGTGRTGTVIACDIAIRALELPTRSVDIPQIAYYVRRGRASSVRTREQYEFIYKIANMYATKLTGPSVEN